MSVQILQLALGMIQTNCYIVADTVTKDTIIIDPAAEPEVILREIHARELIVREILATHTHFDHVLAVSEVVKNTKAPFRMHIDGLEQLQSLAQRAAMFGIQMQEAPPTPDGYIEHGGIIEAGEIKLEARFTPGHSPGHLIFVFEAARVAFVGDSVFMGGIGRTDLPGANIKRFKKSIVEEIMTLPDDFTLCSGHGPVTTLQNEKLTNMSLAELLELPD